MLEEKIIEVLEDRKFEGILQSELAKMLKASKSRVSEILKNLESDGEIVRKREVGKNYRVWLTKYSEGAVKIGILRAVEYAKLISSGNYSFIVYKNAIDLTRDLALGRIDICASPLITQVLFGIMMKNIRIFGVIAENGSGVVFGEEKNGIFATTEMSAMEMNLRVVRERLGVQAFRYCDSPECLLSSLSKAEGIAIWEPYFSSIKRDKIPFKELIGDFPCCTLAINTSFFEKRKEEAENILKNVKRAEIDTDAVSRVLNFTRSEIENSIKSYKFNPDYSIEDILNYLRRAGIGITMESISHIFKEI